MNCKKSIEQGDVDIAKLFSLKPIVLNTFNEIMAQLYRKDYRME